jgi:hypothetical protein
MIGVTASPEKTTPLTPDNIDGLLRTGLSQRGFLTVEPRQWQQPGPAMPTVLLENAIHGIDADHKKQATTPRPWFVAIAHADLVREALAGESLTFLGWTWFPENLPPEWPHGAIRNGKLESHARAQAFLSRFHRGELLDTTGAKSSAIRANATRLPSGDICVYGGNFSREKQQFGFSIKGATAIDATVELLSERGITRHQWPREKSLTLRPMSLFRVRVSTRS